MFLFCLEINARRDGVERRVHILRELESHGGYDADNKNKLLRSGIHASPRENLSAEALCAWCDGTTFSGGKHATSRYLKFGEGGLFDTERSKKERIRSCRWYPPG